MDRPGNEPGVQKIIWVVTTIIIATAYLVTGLGNLLPFAHIAKDMAHLGYPPYFLKILGGWKILAALALTVPTAGRIKEWAYAGMILDLTGAALSRFFTGDAWPMIIVPLGIAGMVTVNYVMRHALQKNAGA